MFTNISMAGSGAAIVILLKVILPMFGIDVDEGTLNATVDAIGTIFGTVMLVLGQLRRPDLIGGIVRR